MRFIALCILVFCLACSGSQPATSAAPAAPPTQQEEGGPSRERILLLDYRDFGPQAAAHRVLGTEWWQWQGHGDSDPATRYAIRVVVYSGISLEEVALRFPVKPETDQDFRYLQLDEALRYLEEEIRADHLPELKASLEATRQRLLE